MSDSTPTAPIRYYSGKRSLKFWKRINALPVSEGSQELYVMGCILQDTELRVLRALENRELKRGQR